MKNDVKDSISSADQGERLLIRRNKEPISALAVHQNNANLILKQSNKLHLQFATLDKVTIGPAIALVNINHIGTKP